MFEYMNMLRRILVERSSTVDSTMDFVAAGSGDELEALMLNDELCHALERLGPPEDEIVRRKHFDGQSFDALGSALGISPNTAKTYYYRALSRLRDLLDSSGDRWER